MILVTGATGAVGSELLRLLSQAGVSTRALTRNPQKAQKPRTVADFVREHATTFRGNPQEA